MAPGKLAGEGPRGWWRRGESPLLGIRRGTRRDPNAWGTTRDRWSCSPVSCRKSTSVIPQVSTVCPVRTRTPGLRSAQGAIASAPGPTRKQRPEGRARGGRGAAAARGLADPEGRRGRVGSVRLPIGWQPRPRGPASQQVPEEAEGGVGARAALNSSNSRPTRQVTSEGRRAGARPHPVPRAPPRGGSMRAAPWALARSGARCSGRCEGLAGEHRSVMAPSLPPVGSRILQTDEEEWRSWRRYWLGTAQAGLESEVPALHLPT